ncbi:Inner membrane protein YdjM [Natranaerofaba carboxydovora]|nr:Inner membrane protein YdjM [Natranaerofaba carboxydovora]
MIFGAASYWIIIAKIYPTPSSPIQLSILTGMFLSMITSVIPDFDLDFGIKHRGPTHSLLAILILALPLLILSYLSYWIIPITLSIFIGYTSHLLADFLTDRGVCFLWPSEKRYGICLWTYNTAWPWEGIFILICNIIVIYKFILFVSISL